MRWFRGSEARQRHQARLQEAAQRRQAQSATQNSGRPAASPFTLIFANRNFALLWWGGLISMIGSWALQIGLPVYVYQTTGSTLATGLTFMVGTVPRILLGSVAGIFIDRWNRQRTMVVTNLLLFAGILPLALVPTTGWLWLVYVVAFVQAAVSRFFVPAENAFLPTVVEEKQLASVNALNALNDNLARLIGPALGGVVMGVVGLQGVVLLDAASFLVAAGCVALVQLNPLPTDEVSPSPESAVVLGGLNGVWQEWLAGLRLVQQNRVVKLLFIIIAITSVGEGVMSALFIPFVTDVLQGEAVTVGWLMSAQAVGGVIGGVLISGLAERFKSYRLLGWGALGLGIIDLAIFNYPFFLPGIMLALVLIALAGLPVSALQAGLLTLFQTNVEDRYRGRVFGAYGTTIALLNLAGLTLAAVLGDPLGVVPVINVQGVAYVAAGLIGLVFLRRQIVLASESFE